MLIQNYKEAMRQYWSNYELCHVNSINVCGFNFSTSVSEKQFSQKTVGLYILWILTKIRFYFWASCSIVSSGQINQE